MNETPALATPECLALPTPGRAETPGLVSSLHFSGHPGSNPGVESWRCSRCGACCELVGCPHLAHDLSCRIYEDRPTECRVPEVLKEVAPGVIEFYCETCKFLMDQKRKWLDAR